MHPARHLWTMPRRLHFLRLEGCDGADVQAETIVVVVVANLKKNGCPKEESSTQTSAIPTSVIHFKQKVGK
jgi:hypothetical protein